MEGEDAFLSEGHAVSDIGMNTRTGRRDFPSLRDEYPTEPTIPASSCRGYPNISSIFEEADNNSCILEETYLAWFNGEPLEEETRNGGTADWCQQKCRNNPTCAGWTLNTGNGWCALKAENQIKRTDNQGFMSGLMNS